MIRSLYSVAIFVEELEPAIRFYRDVLGLPLRNQGSFGAEFLEGPTRIGVHPAGHAEAKGMVGRQTGLTLEVEGLLHFCGDLHAQGVTFVTEPTEMSWGIMAMIADPAGNVLALWEPPAEPQSPASRPGA